MAGKIARRMDMGILKVSGKVLLIPLWFIVSIIGVGVKLLVHMVAIAKKILGFGIVVLFIGTVLCYQDWIQAAFFSLYGRCFEVYCICRRIYRCCNGLI